MTKFFAHAVIGANYGDEGKGANVHHEAHTLMQAHRVKAPTVVRYNGGGQAGHTVELVDGRRRIFSQLGSGSYLGCPTYLSEHFLLNPVTFVNEMRDWINKEVKFPQIPPQVFIHPRAKIVTPWDVLTNQIKERDRAQVGESHGSCGQGIGATMERFECHPRLSLDLVYEDLFDLQKLVTKVASIKDRFYSRFVSSTPAQMTTEPVQEFLASIKLLPRWIEVADYFQLPKNNIVFEGAQGLLLDQDDKAHFPHVTYSKTGSTNIIDIVEKLRVAHWDLDINKVTYCTRPYLTRHGVGPMHAAKGADRLPAELSLIDFEDKTNIPNPWQGSLRLGDMDWDQFEARIFKDFEMIPKGLLEGGEGSVHFPHISVICTDQNPLGAALFAGHQFTKPIFRHFLDGRKGKTNFE